MEPISSAPLPSEPARSVPARNPYAPPASRLDGPAAVAAGGSDGVSNLTLEYLKQTRPWVRLLSVLGFVGAVLLLVIGVGVIAGGTLLEGFASETGMPMAVLGVIYIAMAFLYIAPSIYLWRYAKSIAVLTSSRRVRDLEEALGQQKSFWRFAGICALVILVIYALALVMVVIGGIVAAVS